MLQGFRGSQQKRVLTLAFVDGTGTGIQNVVVGVAAAERFGLAAAGLIIGLLALGRFASPFLFWFTDRHPSIGSEETHTLFKIVVTVMTLSSVGSVVAAVYASPAIIVAVGLIWAFSNSVSSVIATSAIPKALTGYGPFSMVGVALGAWVAASVAAGSGGDGVSAVAIVAVCALLFVQFVEIPLIASVEFRHISQSNIMETVHHAGKGFVVASLTYGPLMVYQALTLQIASVGWVGWAMIFYSLGALTAVPLSWRLQGFRTFSSVLLLASVGVGVWTLALNGPFLLATRFVSGAVLFLVQGRVLQMAFGTGSDASTSRLAGASMGLGVGASLGAVIAAGVAAQYSVVVMGATLGVATLAAAGVVFSVAVLRKKKASMLPVQELTAEP